MWFSSVACKTLSPLHLQHGDISPDNVALEPSDLSSAVLPMVVASDSSLRRLSGTSRPRRAFLYNFRCGRVLGLPPPPPAPPLPAITDVSRGGGGSSSSTRAVVPPSLSGIVSETMSSSQGFMSFVWESLAFPAAAAAPAAPPAAPAPSPYSSRCGWPLFIAPELHVRDALPSLESDMCV